jgi:transcriptional regulator with XRE-family HTH domain
MDLREIRKNKGLTIEQVAAQLSKSHSSVSNWESGKWEPQLTPEQTNVYCEILGLTFDEFLKASRRSRKNWLEKQSR